MYSVVLLLILTTSIVSAPTGATLNERISFKSPIGKDQNLSGWFFEETVAIISDIVTINDNKPLTRGILTNINGFRSKRTFYEVDLYAHTDTIKGNKLLKGKNLSEKKDPYGYIINFSPRQFEQADLGKGLSMMMDGVSFYFVEDGQLKFDTMVIHELEKKEMVNIGSIFKEKKLKHVDFTGFEFDVKFVFEVNRVDNSITLSQKKENKTEKIIIKYNLKTENKFQDRVFLTIIAFSGKVTSLTLNINK